MKVQVVLTLFLFLGGCAHFQDRHTFKKGETLERVSHRYQLHKKRLAKLNKKEDLTRIINLALPRKMLKARFTYPLKRMSYLREESFIWPVRGKLTSRFGYRWGMLHNGIDISAPSGTPIKAAKAGRVIHSARVAGYGNLVIVYHGAGYSTVYAHTLKLLVRKGVKVKGGQRIALVGSSGKSTGPHLHFEVRKHTTPKNPIYYLP